MEQVHLTRQLDVIPLDVLGHKIQVIGAGAVGSFTALNLAKMGFSDITVYDYDTIDNENMNCQFYRMSDIGRPKVVALKEIINEFTGVEITAVNKPYLGGTLPGIVISAVDSMDVRRKIWEEHYLKAFNTPLIIDPRMSVEFAMAYAMNPMDRDDNKSYHATLYSDHEAVQERCTAKSTVYTATMLAGLVCTIVKSRLTQEEDGDYIRNAQWDIPTGSMQAWKKCHGTEQAAV